MKQVDLDRAISCATGEPVHRIQRLGFSLWEPSAEEGPNVIDWDEFQPHSVSLFPSSAAAQRNAGGVV